MYANDTGGLFAYQDPVNPILGQDLWMGTLSNYIAVIKICVCPLTKVPTPLPQGNIFGTADIAWVWGQNLPEWTGSYGLNGWLYVYTVGGELVGGGSTDPENLFKKPAGVNHTTMTPIFFDSTWVDTWPETNDTPSTDLYNGNTPQSADGGLDRETIARHGGAAPHKAPTSWPMASALPGGINMAFFDGHVAFTKLQALWTCYWNLYWRPSAAPPHG
jgi:prepilin-type processing-associated H-X9-DG protein